MAIDMFIVPSLVCAAWAIDCVRYLAVLHVAQSHPVPFPKGFEHACTIKGGVPSRSDIDDVPPRDAHGILFASRKR